MSNMEISRIWRLISNITANLNFNYTDYLYRRDTIYIDKQLTEIQ